MFRLKNHAETPENDDDETFYRRIRETIEEKSGETNGIRVFEHSDTSTLDDYERSVLANLRKAHKDWKAKNEKSTEKPQEDAFASVKMKVSS